MNSSNRTPIFIALRGLEEVPSFKNSKQIVRIKGRPMLITKPERQKWMERATLAIESQLRSELRTRGIEITTGPSALSLIVSLLPPDDSHQWISEHSVKSLEVSKGEAGADILIERID